MNFYKIYTTSENKAWRRYFTFAYEFTCGNKEMRAAEFLLRKLPRNIKIRALNNGNVIKDESFFTKIKEEMPDFSMLQGILLIREDILDARSFPALTGTKLLKVKVDGTYSKNYKLLAFDTIVDCIDEALSKRGSFDFAPFSTLVLDGRKIPARVDGFFLKNWDKYGNYITIANERAKNILLNLPRASDVLIFKKLDVSNI